MTQATELRELATLLDVSSGNVGIGLPSGTASNKLVISDGVRTSAAITQGTTALEIARTGGGDVGILINKDTAKWLIGIDNSDGNAGPLRFLYGAYNQTAHPGFGTAADGLNLAYNGNVGIGVKAPSAKLHINSDTNDATGIGFQNNSRYMGLEVEGGGLRVKDVSAGLVERFRIASNGDVTIGDITAEHKLDVDGAIATRQVRHSIAPTLNLDFANSKELDSRITFYRDSIATYYDSKGVLRYANHNEPRFDHDPYTGESKGLLIEEARTNLFTNYTPILDTSGNEYYTKHNRYAGVSPTGKHDATYVKDTNDTQYHWFGDSWSATSGTLYTVSFYAKAINQTSISAEIALQAPHPYATYTLTGDGSVTNTGNVTTTDIENVGNGWYRCSITFTAVSTNSSQLRIHLASTITTYAGDGTHDILFWGHQVEEGAFPTSFMPSDTRFTSRSSKATYYDENGILRTAPKDGARYGYEYDGRKWVETGLILENASTKLVNEVSQLVGSGWNFEAGNLGQVFVRNTTETTAPDGSYTAVKCDVTALGTDMTFSDFLNQPGQNWANTTKTFSVFVKGTAGETISAKIDGAGGGGSFTDHTLTGGWDRISATFTYPSGYGVNGVIRIGPRQLSGSSAGTARVWYVWGGQLEDSHFMSSYIYGGLNTTRSADVASSVAYTRETDYAKIHNFSDHFDSTELTTYLHASSDSEPEGNARYYEAVVVEGNVKNRMLSYYNTQYRWLWKSKNVNDVVFQGADTWSNFNEIKQAVTWKNGVANLADSTGNSQSDTSAGSESVFTTLHIGNDTDENSPICAHFRKLSFYEKALSSAELQALTENN